MLRARWGGITIDFYPVAVQGQDAVKEICAAFHFFNSVTKIPEALILTRGGGSLEDLIAFNSEEVARAIFSSKIPVLAAIGHERDISIAELVADVRASTPSNAAELLAPDRVDFFREIQNKEKNLGQIFTSRL